MCTRSILVVLGIASLVSASGHALAQEGGEWLEVVDDVDREELLFFIGPIDLPAGSGHHAVKQPPLLTGQVPADVYLYGFEVQMLDAAGEPIPNRLMHHVNLIDPDHRELFSPVSRRLFAAGSETQAASIPRLLGVPLQRGQRLTVAAMFHNPTEIAYPGARLRVTLKYRKRGWLFPISVYPVYIDVQGHVGVKEFDLPPGRSEWTWEGRPAVAGRLLASSGHMHDHAVNLRFEDLTAGAVLWETGPEVDADGRVVAVPVGKFWWRGGLRLTPEHTYRLTVVYDNPTGAVLPGGGMGVLGGVFIVTGGAEWPELDRGNLRYVEDMKQTRETAERRALGMAGMEVGKEHGHAHRH